MTYHVITTQPQIFASFLKTGLIARGLKKKIIEIKIRNLHDFAFDKRQSIDDSPYGGGAGMILRVDVVAKSLSHLKPKNSRPKTILLTPQGKKFTQKDAKRLSKQKDLVIIAGRFEGYDERIRNLVDEEISIGDYILTSGDLPAMVIIDAISRQIPGFIERKESIKNESFNPTNNLPLGTSTKNSPLLEYPQFTRPYDFKDVRAVEVKQQR